MSTIESRDKMHREKYWIDIILSEMKKPFAELRNVAIKGQIEKEEAVLKKDLNEYMNDLQIRYEKKIENLPASISRNSMLEMGSSFEKSMIEVQKAIIQKIDEFTKNVDNSFIRAASWQGKTITYSFQELTTKMHYKQKCELNWYGALEDYAWFQPKRRVEDIIEKEIICIKRNFEQYWLEYDEEFQKCIKRIFDVKEHDVNKTKTFTKTSISNMTRGALSISQMIFNNPILKADRKTREEYLQYLEKYSGYGNLKGRKYADAQLKLYREVLENAGDGTGKDIKAYFLFLLLDLLQMAEYDKEILQTNGMKFAVSNFLSDFQCSEIERAAAELFISKAEGGLGGLEKAYRVSRDFSAEIEIYAGLAEKNMQFKHMRPLLMIVTATMSAGKSTLINAITGKNISLSQNLACTSKIHTIISKAFDDGVCYKMDYGLNLRAEEKELLNNHEKNTKNKIRVSTYYHGILGGTRSAIYDSPGVNFSGSTEHRQMTEQLIQKKGYDLLIYIMNATQLSTEDDKNHLEFVRKNCGHVQILFILNKMDTFQVEEENAADVLQRAKMYLEKLGFQNPMICPLSAKAGFLAKKNMQTEISRTERRELYNLIDKFEQMNLPEYYQKYFPMIRIEDKEQEELQLLKTCGLSYVETIIYEWYRGGEINGTSIR